jgi:hypothetical protein
MNIDNDTNIQHVKALKINPEFYYDGYSPSVTKFTNSTYIEYPEKITITTTNALIPNTTFLGAKEIVDGTTLPSEIYNGNAYVKKLTLTGITNGSDTTGGFKVGNNCALLEEINIVNDVYMSDIKNAPMLHTLRAPNVKYIRAYSNEGATYSNLNNLSNFELENLEDTNIQNFESMQKLHTINLPKL